MVAQMTRTTVDDQPPPRPADATDILGRARELAAARAEAVADLRACRAGLSAVGDRLGAEVAWAYERVSALPAPDAALVESAEAAEDRSRYSLARDALEARAEALQRSVAVA
jgi:hypothetical protein